MSHTDTFAVGEIRLRKMPTLISETDVKLERIDMMRRIELKRDVSSQGWITERQRTPGLHLSGLLKYVAVKSRISARLQEIEDEEMPLRWALGHAWEEFAASLEPEMVWQPYEALTPVVMNCDGICFPEDQTDRTCPMLIKEYKFNRAKKYSGTDLIRKKWLWMCQGQGYCIGYGASRVEWNVLSVMEWPDPVWTKYLVEFDQTELDAIANMIEINREGAIREGYCE